MIRVIKTGPFDVNTYIVELTGSFVFIVDPAACALSGDEDKIVSFLHDNKLVPCALILTHGHFDHVLGLSKLKKDYPEVPILINKNDCHLIGKDACINQKKLLSQMSLDILYKGLENLPQCDAYLLDNETLDVCLDPFITDDRVKKLLHEYVIINTPGHTRGSICLYNSKEGLLISGDTVFYGSYGRTDLIGGSQKDMIESLNRIYNNIDKNTSVYPGHGEYGFKLKDNLNQ